MITQSLTRLTLAVGGLAISLTAGTAIASAAPDLNTVINTPCNYRQVTAALNAEHPAEAAEFNANSNAQGMLQMFLNSPPQKRQQLAVMVQGMPEAQQYIGTITEVANTCTNY